MDNFTCPTCNGLINDQAKLDEIKEKVEEYDVQMKEIEKNKR